MNNLPHKAHLTVCSSRLVCVNFQANQSLPESKETTKINSLFPTDIRVSLKDATFILCC
jgi:hypothetical protein